MNGGGMKIWFNKVNESRRSVVELEDAEIRLGRDAEINEELACLERRLAWAEEEVLEGQLPNAGRAGDGHLRVCGDERGDCVCGR